MSKEENNSKNSKKEPKKDEHKKSKTEVENSKTKANEEKKPESLESKLQRNLTQLQKEKDDLEDKYLRSQAEMQNMQNRYNKERAQLIKYESQSLAKDVLPAMDNLERALATKVDDEASKQLKKGVQMTLDSLVKAMKDHGISEIIAEGVKFDPNLHQAVQTVAAENDDQKDHVVRVLQKGYLYKDRTLRPAMVVVAQ
ncbi:MULTISPECIES: nucleotide exchange factor GrpE [Lactobacillus]|uniref:Protein GrpE n=1 Tax=Lactobacillus melliventris TaxID=1218507 RepID=A0A0F4LEN1_9LACO|nr:MULTISPECIES: nucleotide exchange factor GrpE [Lactobacillus]MBH9989656.1 nucleotide exchange factor GrpE [Lactobacillus sp. M0392]MBI0023359.1 nucleotide exchange factor GrpE [Lactobacillus sp. W8171]MBI0044521.1 nucleotide exchange factor GrpE [Lactobacillus sp. M0393]KJY56724.1 Protein GrpE [Lactobacillus melliventris]MBC6350389.1 nucleotide exchange factor GrpE [Lactobacillus melliventris]